MGVTLLMGLRFQRWAAWALLGLFVVQLPLTSTGGRLALSGVYAAITLAALGNFHHRSRNEPAHLRLDRRIRFAEQLIHPMRQENNFVRVQIVINPKIISRQTIAVPMPRHHFHGHE